MDRGDLRGTLLTTSSALALCVGMGGSAWAACTFQNTAPVTAAGANNCITFFNGAASTGNVTNNGTLTGIVPYPPVTPGSATGISVVKSGTVLNGNIVNNGTISAQSSGINVGQGSTGAPPTNVNVGATVNGSITNAGTITNTAGAGIYVVGSKVLGSIVNTTAAHINTANVGIFVSAASALGSTVNGSIVNNGSIITNGNDGIFAQHASVNGAMINTGNIAVGIGSGAMVFVNGTLTGGMTNSGTLSANVAGMEAFASVSPTLIIGNVVNALNGTINAHFGMFIGGSNTGGNFGIITGNVQNAGTITASSRSGIEVRNATIGGAVLNTGSITSPQYGIIIANTSGVVAAATVAGGVTNSGTITSTGTTSFAGIAIAGASISNGIVNALGGSIQATQGVGILIGDKKGTTTTIVSSVAGGIANLGTITARTGILVTANSIVTGTVANSGNLTGTTAAMDFTGAGATMTIAQQGGTITGNILLSPHSDTLAISGGAITGNVVGANNATGGTVNFALGAGTFTTGGTFNVANINVNSGTVVLANDATVFGALTNNATLQLNNTGMRTLTGAFKQNAAGTLAMEISPTGSAQLHVTGNATLAGTLLPVYDPGVYSAKTYTLMQAGSVTGNFAQLTGTPPTGFVQAESTTGTQVLLALSNAPAPPPGPTPTPTPTPTPAPAPAPGPPIVVPPTNATDFSATTSTLILNDQLVIGTVLNQIGAHFGGTDNGTGFASLAAPPADMQMQLASLGGNTNLAAIEQVAQVLPQAISDNGGWFRGIGSFASVDHSGMAPGFNANSAGFLAGYDRPIAPDLYAGIAGGYTHSDVSVSPTSGTVDTARVLIYGGGALGPGFWSATAGYAHDSISTARPFLGVGTATESHGGNEFTGGAQWSLPTPLTGFGGGIATLTPKVGAMFIHLGEDGFAESGADGLDLSSSGHSTDSVQPFIGLSAMQTFVTADGTQLVPELHLAYSHELANDNRLLNVGTVSGATFLIQGVKPSRDMLTAGAGVTVRAQDNLAFYATYDAVVHTGNTTDQTVSAGLRIRF
jgi:fibronectin-binding autotransporter adhesin